MYESFYGLSGKPFQLNPDPAFYFGSRQHKRAMSYLEYGLHQNEGFIVITGEIGAGKTTLVRNLLSQLNDEQVVAAHLVSTQLDADDTLRMVAAAFGIPTKKVDKSELLLLLEAYLVSVARDGKRCLLVVDEAQNLTPRAVEELRMLSNFQLETHALLQSFLIGQPEFRETLQGPEMEQLRQRVIAACHVGPLGEAETQGYIEHRLGCVGWKNIPQFLPEAHRAIFGASGGIPRRINAVCDRLLWYGYLADKKIFSDTDVEEVAAEMDDESRPSSLAQHAHKTDTTAGNNAVDSTMNSGQLMQMPEDYKAAGDAYNVISSLCNDVLGEQLLHIEQGMRRLDATMLRIERSNLVSTAMFRRLLDWMRTRETGRDDVA
ncbi:MAG: AAA family ATPase [Betaproteobacteria bacterium]|nr:AAA family ATPase [Betaproteobacteria bacterium]